MINLLKRGAVAIAAIGMPLVIPLWSTATVAKPPCQGKGGEIDRSQLADLERLPWRKWAELKAMLGIPRCHVVRNGQQQQVAYVANWEAPTQTYLIVTIKYDSKSKTWVYQGYRFHIDP